MTDPKFTHLHLHTSYSLLDGAIRIPELMEYCKENGMDSVAMTDHGNMFGAIEFYKSARKHGIKPIIGNEFYVSPGSRLETRQIEKLADGNNYHLILLATNEKGYANLIRLTSRSYTEGFYRKPRIDYDLLASHSEGLVALSACIAGEVQSKVIQGRMDEATNLAGRLREIFGPDRFFLEIQKHGIPEEETAAKGNVEIAKRLGIPLVLTNDSHYLRREDREAQDILLRINQKKTIDDPLYFGFNEHFYVKTPGEMSRLFPELPEAVSNTQRIAEMVDLNFQFGNPLLPRFDVPAGENLDSYMQKLALEGLAKRYGGSVPKEVKDRFDFEYGVITKMDFSGYFLIVQDFINWAKRTGVPVGPGRGSAAGSIVAFGLGITDIDPLKYDLLFERFLNPDRKEMPDIDVDFCAERREEVINYVRDKYGRDHVGQIITYGTMAAKACLKDVARVLNIPFDEANQISKKFPDVLGITIDEALKTSRELKEYSEQGDVQKRLFTVARKLEGNVRHTGVHAAGVVIAPRPLEELVPLASVAEKSGDKSSPERVIVTQYDMSALTEVGLVKMDFLGLRNLTIIDACVRELKAKHSIALDMSALPMDDEKTYSLLHRGEVAGVFQLESDGMREFVMRSKPANFEDIIALIALYRPGPLQSGMAESFINRKNGREKVTYAHKDLEDVLGSTYGVIVYQEQVMLISRIIAGFTPGEADALRKAMGKKIAEKMAELRVKFVEGGTAKGHNRKFLEELYDQMAEFAKYGFNKSHSAAYAMIVYQTAYLKANYPTEYMRAVLDSEINRTEKLVFYINACREMGIKILGPDINESGFGFTTISPGVIRFGLLAVKGVGSLAVESVLKSREEKGRFALFSRFAESVDLRQCNRRTMEALIQAGVFDSLGYKRRALMEGLEAVLNLAQKKQADLQIGQSSLFDFAATTSSSKEATDDLIPRGNEVQEFDEATLLQNEKEVLGFYFSGHPLARFEKILKSTKTPTIADLAGKRSGDRVELAAVISAFSMRPTKNNREMCRLTLEDMTGSAQGVIFPSQLEKVRAMLQADTPLYFRASIEKKEETETVSLIVDDLKPLDTDLLEEKLERSFHLKLASEGFNDTTVGKIQTILKNYQGNLRVYFHLINGGGEDDKLVIRAHDSFSVQMNRDMVDRLKSVPQVSGIYLTVGNQVRSLWKKTAS